MKHSLRFTRLAFTALLVALVASLVAIPAFAANATAQAERPLAVGSAAEPDVGTQAANLRYVEETNPLYADELANVDLIDEEAFLANAQEEKGAAAGVKAQSLRSLGSADGLHAGEPNNDGVEPVRKYPYEYNCATADEAVKRIREALLSHADALSVTVEVGDDYPDALQMFYNALSEPDGESPEGYASKVDYLRYNYLQVGCSPSFTDDYTAITYEYYIEYAATSTQTAQLYDAAEQLVESFGFGESTSDVQKFKVIYDFICGHVSYDWAHLENDGYTLKYSAYAALMNGTAVCQGYSQLLYVMCGLAGIPSRIISGVGVGEYGPEAHAWNIVGLKQGDGSCLYYDVDATWDSTCYQAAQPYEYFLLSDADFSDHSRGSWEDIVDYGSYEFHAAHSMAERSYVSPVVTVDDIDFTLVGDEAVASAYNPAASSGGGLTNELVIPESVMVDGRPYTVTTVGAGFLGSSEAAEAIGKVVLPATITSIQTSAFEQSSVSAVVFPEGLVRIGDYAFWNCNNLTEISLPESLELVGEAAFAYCLMLEKVKVLGPTAIGAGAFVGLRGYDLYGDNTERKSTITVSTPCQYSLISDSGDSYITAAATALILAEGVSSEAGHKLFHVEEAAVTCESAGFAEYWECRVCGKLFADGECASELQAPSVFQPLGHSWDEGVIVKPATETEEGTRVYTCVRCGMQHFEAVPMLTWMLVSTVEPTCENDGYHLYSNANGDEMRERILALGHAWDEGTVIEPTCTEDGCTVHRCTRCRYSYADSAVPALGHDWGEWVTDAEATCTEAGTETRGCARCGATDTREIEALGHDYTAAITEPTCTAGGYTTHTCSRCEDAYIDSETPALGHAWDEGIITVEPTCTEDGERTHTCLRCDDAELVKPEPALGHDYVAVVTPPTCTEGGYTTYTCSRCGDSYEGAKTAALGHKWDAGKVTTAPTYTAKGVKTFTCVRCGATRTEAIAALPKLAQTIAPAKKTYVVKFSKVKKKAQKVAVKFKSNGGAITYKAAKTAGGKVKIAKNGKVTVAKGTKKGTYTLKVKVTAAATTSHNAASATVKLKIRVK